MTTWTGAVNTAWGAVPGAANNNWSPAFTPTSTDAVIFAASSAVNCVAPSGAQCLSLSCTGYIGQLSGDIGVYGNAMLASGMTASALAIGFHASGSLNTVGTELSYFYCDTDNVTMTLLSDVTVNQEIYIDGSTGQVLAFGSHKIIFTNAADLYATNATVTYSTGAELRYQIGDGHGGGLNLEPDMATVLFPPITIQKKVGDTGTGTWFCQGPIKCESLTLNSCQLHIITVGGNFSTSIDLNGNLGTDFYVTGTATATGVTITGCDFSGGTALDATNGCYDGLGNTYVTFSPQEIVAMRAMIIASATWVAAGGVAASIYYPHFTWAAGTTLPAMLLVREGHIRTTYAAGSGALPSGNIRLELYANLPIAGMEYTAQGIAADIAASTTGLSIRSCTTDLAGDISEGRQAAINDSTSPTFRIAVINVAYGLSI